MKYCSTASVISDCHPCCLLLGQAPVKHRDAVRLAYSLTVVPAVAGRRLSSIEGRPAGARVGIRFGCMHCRAACKSKARVSETKFRATDV